jgi:hypothetical protein
MANKTLINYIKFLNRLNMCFATIRTFICKIKYVISPTTFHMQATSKLTTAVIHIFPHAQTPNSSFSADNDENENDA